jgi:acyl dehydratase
MECPMTMIAQGFGENVVTAFLDGPDNPNIPNAIHSTEGAKDYGYKAALVGGVTVWGWATPTILEAIGDRWLADGWAHIRFRRPTYPGDELTIRVDEADTDGAHELRLTKADGENAIVGVVGLGKAPWFAELAQAERRIPEPVLDELSPMSLDLAHAAGDIRPMATEISTEEAREYAIEKQRMTNPLFVGEHPRVHPGWSTGRMIRLLHHTFDYGPAIHAQSHIQHLAPFEAGQTIVQAGRIVDAYERKGHHYAILDGMLLGQDGTELVRLRHTTIFQVAKRGQAD